MNICIVIIAIIASVLSIPFVFVSMLMLAWSTTHTMMVNMVLINTLLVYVYVWMNIITYTKEKKWIRKRFHIAFLTITLVTGITTTGFYLYDRYEAQFVEVGSEVDLNAYQPFESDQVATLKESATLQLTQDLPNIDGATALYPMYSAMVQAIYPKGEYSPYSSVVMCSTTPEAYQRLLNGEADVIFVAGPSQKQIEAFKNAVKEMKMTPIAKEAFVFFVHVDNPIDSLTLQQIKDIYSGKITNWKEVGGPDERIKAFQRPEGSGSQSTLQKLMEEQTIMEPLQEEVVEGMGGIIKQTATYKNKDNAIGYTFRFFSDEMVKNKEIKLLQVNGVSPSVSHIQNETYPIVSDIYAITLTSNIKPNVELFLKWITSAQGKELIQYSGYVAN